MAPRKRAAGASAPARRVTAAKKAAAEVLAAQRRDIAVARELCRALVAELNCACTESEAIEEALAQALENDKRRQTAALKENSLGGRAAIMRELATATKTLIELERQVFDLSTDDDGGDIQPGISAVDAIAARIARLADTEEAAVAL